MVSAVIFHLIHFTNLKEFFTDQCQGEDEIYYSVFPVSRDPGLFISWSQEIKTSEVSQRS